MKRLSRSAVFVLLGFWFAPLLFSGNNDRERNLSPKTQDFLKLTAYIILPQEKSVLLKLETERDQAIFIESFWKQRDPTPGTPQNEYQEEIIKRFNHANKFYGRGTTREGWMTDRGKVYIVLGEPASKQDLSGRPGIQPCEIWYYYGDKEKGLPVHFGLVFFKRRGSGELVLYDSVSDGIPSLLLNAQNMTFDQNAELYQRLEELVPELAPVALSIIPGEIPSNFMPSLRDSIIMADIFDSPKKAINPTYATHFLDYKGLVSTEYMTNFVDSAGCVDLVRDPLTGLDFLHFSIAPKTLSFDYFGPKNQHFCNLQLSVSLRQDNRVIYQYSKEYPVYFPPEDADRIKANGLSVEDVFPVIEGRFRLNVLLQNSVGKEFSILETDVVIRPGEGRPRIYSPAVGYALKEYRRDLFIPYKLTDRKLLVDPSRTFSTHEPVSFFFCLVDVPETLWKDGRIEVTFSGSKPGQPAIRPRVIALLSQPYARNLAFVEALPPAALPPDYYTLSLVLRDASGRALDENKAEFVVSASQEVPHPMAQAKLVQMGSPAPFYYMLAGQSEKMGRDGPAEAFYRQAFALSPQTKRGLIEYSRFLLKIGKPEKSLELIERISADPASRFDYFLTKGLAAMAMGQPEAAVADLLEGNKIYNSDTLLLNSLGACYARLGQKEKALTALRSSLRLNPKQDEIRKLIAEIEKTPPQAPNSRATA